MVKKLFQICFFLAIIICTTSCAPYKNLSTNRFEKKIKDNTIQLVDVRTPEEYAEGHIPGSLNIDVKDKENFPTSVDKFLDKEKKGSTNIVSLPPLSDKEKFIEVVREIQKQLEE